MPGVAPADAFGWTDADNIVHFRLHWDATAAGALGLVGDYLRPMLNGRIIYIDWFSSYFTCAANETYIVILYDGGEGAKNAYAATGSITGGTAKLVEHHGPWGPFVSDMSGAGYIIGVWAGDGAFTAGDTFPVWLGGRALPRYTESTTPPAAPVTVEKMNVFPWRR